MLRTGRLHVDVIAAVFTLALTSVLSATAAAEEKTVDVAASVSPGEARPGEVVTVSVKLDIRSGYHLYSMTRIPDGPLPLTISVEAPGLEALGEWHAPAPELERDPNFEKVVEYFAGAVTHTRAYRLPGTADGATELSLKLRGQICDDKRCIPFRKKAKVTARVTPGEARPDRVEAPAMTGEAFPPDRPAPSDLASGSNLPTEGGLIAFLIIAFLAGLGALVTPCVFPMIPITISFFSKYAKVSLRRSVTMASIYAISIIITFTAIGVIVSLIFGAVGMQTLSASGGFNVFLTLLLVVFAFNLFGLFEIQVPSWLITRTSEKERALTSNDGSLFSQAAGVFFMALTFTLVSFTCTVAFIGVVLAEAAKGNMFYPAMGMLSFSLAFSTPFFFLAVFPSWAEKLQGKGGDWMVAVKVVLGFLELAGAFKFLSNVDLVWGWGFVTRPLVLAIWVACFGGAGLYLLRVFNLPHSDPDARTIGPIRMFFALVLIALATYSATGIRDTKSMGGWLDGWLPPAVYPGQEATGEAGDGDHLPWIVDDIGKGMERAKEERKPVFLDFTGYTCTNCRYMEGSVFPRPAVRSRLEKMVLVTAYTDCEKDVCEQQRDYQVKRFDTAALPFYAIINPFDDTVLAKHPDMTRDVDAYVRFLDEGIRAFDRVKPAADTKESTGEAAAAAPATAEEKTSLTLAPGGKAVDFEFPGLADGKKRKLSSSRGKWVLVNFWASWCAPCKKELKEDFPPALASAPHVELVTVAFDGEETKQAAIDFAREVKLAEEKVLLGGEDITEAGLDEAFDITEALPISYLIHPDGHIAWMLKGSVHKEMLIELFAGTRKVE